MTTIVPIFTENVGFVVWIIVTTGSVIGLLVYNAKVVVPNLIKRIDTVENNLKEVKEAIKTTTEALRTTAEELKKLDFVSKGDCLRKHEDFEKQNEREHSFIQSDIKKVLKCVEKIEHGRQRDKVIQYSFMTAVKENLKLRFDIPKVEIEG